MNRIIIWVGKFFWWRKWYKKKTIDRTKLHGNKCINCDAIGACTRYGGNNLCPCKLNEILKER